MGRYGLKEDDVLTVLLPMEVVHEVDTLGKLLIFVFSPSSCSTMMSKIRK